MGKGIKTRVSAKKGIKAIDKAAVASERMKEAYIRTKDKADHSLYAEESSPGEYASDRLSAGVDNVTHEAVHQFDKQGRRGVQTTKENISQLKEKSKSGKPQPNSRKNKRRNSRLSRLGSPPHAGVAVRQPIRFPSRPRRSVRSAGPSRPWTAARKALRQWTGAEKTSSRLLPRPREP